MKRLLSLFAALCLSACVSYQPVSREAYNEHISSLLFSREDNSVYALGERFDYRALPCNSGVDGSTGFTVNPSDYAVCMGTLNWIMADDTRRATIAAEIPRLEVESGAQNKIYGHYRAYRRLSRDQAENLGKQHIHLSEASASDAERLSARLNRKISADGLYFAEIWFYGQTVHIANRQEILQLGQLKQPITVSMQHRIIAKQHRFPPIGQIAEGIIVAPLGLILLVPALVSHGV